MNAPTDIEKVNTGALDRDLLKARRALKNIMVHHAMLNDRARRDHSESSTIDFCRAGLALPALKKGERAV